jgi:hypothetical protein
LRITGDQVERITVEMVRHVHFFPLPDFSIELLLCSLDRLDTRRHLAAFFDMYHFDFSC